MANEQNSSASAANQSNRGTGRANNNNNNSKTKKDAFKGAIDGLRTLALANERKRGSPANFDAFIHDICGYVGREVGKKLAKKWGIQVVRSWKDDWKPTRPIKPDESNYKDPTDLLEALDDYQEELTIHKKTLREDWEAVRIAIWFAILGQCSDRLKGHLQQLKFYEQAAYDYDIGALLRNANVLSGGGDILGWEARAQQKALCQLFRLRQNNLSLNDYFNEFKARVAAVETLGGNLRAKTFKWIGGDGTKVESDEAVLVCLFLENASNEYNECLRSLDNDASTKTIRYPATLEDAYTTLDKFVKPIKNNPSNNNLNAYLDIDPSLPENEICLTSTKYGWMIDAFWILLDTASTVTIFCNALFLRGIREAKVPTIIHTSGGTITATLEGYLPFLRRYVAFHPDCLGNILSFRDVLRAHHMTFNSRQSHRFTVHCQREGGGRSKTKVHFRPSGTGLYYFDTQGDLRDRFFSIPRKRQKFPRVWSRRNP